ncbi:MAG: 50S ribosomal protein L18 [Leptospiraceae bacterium]|nr:50S ribosomal protein L18 [Leptospiraceae bacterium]MCB1302924.1 50S ribosomal protein L18 [Leptospiraceae bacterium]
MNRLEEKRHRLSKRIQTIRKAIRSRKRRPRLVLNRTNKYLFAQIIDDENGKVLCTASTLEKNFSGPKKNIEAAKKLGEVLAGRAKEKGVSSVVFDRRGRLYHGRMAQFAEAAREGGLEF